MSNDNNTNGLLSTAWKTINNGGPVAVMAAALLYIVYIIAIARSETVLTKIDAVEANGTQIMQEHKEMRMELQEVRVITTTEQTKQTKILQTICKSLAKSTAMYQECVQPD